MTITARLTATLGVAAVCFIAGPATAKEIPIAGNSAKQVKSGCGGTYLPPSKSNGSYGCVEKDGHGIYCGGETPAQKKTCSKFLIRGPGTRPALARLGARSKEQVK